MRASRPRSDGGSPSWGVCFAECRGLAATSLKRPTPATNRRPAYVRTKARGRCFYASLLRSTHDSQAVTFSRLPSLLMNENVSRASTKPKRDPALRR